MFPTYTWPSDAAARLGIPFHEKDWHGIPLREKFGMVSLFVKILYRMYYAQQLKYLACYTQQLLAGALLPGPCRCRCRLHRACFTQMPIFRPVLGPAAGHSGPSVCCLPRTASALRGVSVAVCNTGPTWQCPIL